MSIPAPDNQLRGRVALVTGAGRGIGRAVALALAGAGMTVGVNYRRSQTEAQALVDLISNAGGMAAAVQADVCDIADVRRLVHTIDEKFGPVAVLVNNAGTATAATIESIDERLWSAALAQNLTSAFLVTQACVPAMRSMRWGRIINISSAAARSGGIVGPHYAAAKAGLEGLTRYCAQQLAAGGVTVNAVLPALVYTEMLAARPDITPGRVPVGRFGHVDEVASAVMMLASNGYMTGQSLHVNGGSYFS